MVYLEDWNCGLFCVGKLAFMTVKKSLKKYRLLLPGWEHIRNGKTSVGVGLKMSLCNKMGIVKSSARWCGRSRGEEKSARVEIHPWVTSDVFRLMNTNGNAFSFFAMKHPCVDSHFSPAALLAPLAHKRRCAGGEKNSSSNLHRRARSQICVHDAAAAARERAHNSRSACLSGNMASSVYMVHTLSCVHLFICTTAAATASGADEEMRQLEQFIMRAEFALYLHLGCRADIYSIRWRRHHSNVGHAGRR
jgi:hypothetical protein